MSRQILLFIAFNPHLIHSRIYISSDCLYTDCTLSVQWLYKFSTVRVQWMYRMCTVKTEKSSPLYRSGNMKSLPPSNQADDPVNDRLMEFQWWRVLLRNGVWEFKMKLLLRFWFSEIVYSPPPFGNLDRDCSPRYLSHPYFSRFGYPGNAPSYDQFPLRDHRPCLSWRKPGPPSSDLGVYASGEG